MNNRIQKIAQTELDEARETLAHLQTKNKPAQLIAIGKQVAAFEKIVNDPVALEKWWNSISLVGRELILKQFRE